MKCSMNVLYRNAIRAALKEAYRKLDLHSSNPAKHTVFNLIEIELDKIFDGEKETEPTIKPKEEKDPLETM